jgi:acyl-CoA reductase-like NAD-dependent aldehyde dehydrogenase
LIALQTWLTLPLLAPALLAGCPVTWKPSPKASGVAEAALALAAFTTACDLLELLSAHSN